MRYSRGFTLVELMIVLAIISVAAMVAVPSFSSLIERNRLTSSTNQLLGFFNGARVEAIKRNAIVRIDPVTAGAWSGRLVAWVDENGDGNRADSEVFREFDPLPAGFSLALTGGGDVGFRPSGLSRTAGTLNLNLCPGAGKPGRVIEIHAGGRMRSSEITCS